MSDSSAKAVSGPVVLPTESQALQALTGLAAEVAGYLRLRDQERARREQIATYRELELDKIRAAEQLITRYFEQSFSERADIIKNLFAHLDHAVERGDDGSVRETLAGIVDIAKTSPLAAAGDLSQIRAALDDPKHTWQF